MNRTCACCGHEKKDLKLENHFGFCEICIKLYSFKIRHEQAKMQHRKKMLNYFLRNIPLYLWRHCSAKAKREGKTAREVLISAIIQYADSE